MAPFAAGLAYIAPQVGHCWKSMRMLRGLACVLAGGLCSWAAPALDSGAPAMEEAAPAAAAKAPAKPVNLTVLKDMPVARLERVMKRYERELGVTCSYCHVENRDTGELDYASDENPKKETARIMIAMLDDINERHLARLGGDQRYAADITCGSCHQGRANPPSWEARRR